MCDERRLAPCGIDCSGCPIRVAAGDAKAAEGLAREWRNSFAPDAEPSWFRCQGCWGDRSVRWSDDCRIFACCVEQRGLSSCHECPDFPCGELLEWAEAYDNHGEAMGRLRRMREGADGRKS